MCVACGPVVEAGAPAPNDVGSLARDTLCSDLYIFASAACQGSVRCPGRAGYYYYTTHTHTHIQNCHFI